MLDVRRALAVDHPLPLLELVSSLLAIVDPRRRNPFDREELDDDTPTCDTLVDSFVGVDLTETAAVLTVIAELTGDELLRARIRAELASRSHVLPVWVGTLAGVEATRAVEMVHVLGDGDNVIVGAVLPSGHELSVVVYIDHNLGTVVKDAFAVPEPIADVVAIMRANVDDPDTTWNEIDPADARARIVDAVEAGARTFPPFETDSWPACRPLVEWVTRHLPTGGTGYVRPECDDAGLDALAERFVASAFGAGFGDADHRGLLDSLLWFGSGYGPGDPLRWSPVAVEMLLADWIPRKIVADAAYLAMAPDLLRSFIRFCHHERGIREALTTETLDAVDEWEPTYQRTIRSPRLQGPAALLAAAGVLDPDADWPLFDDPQTRRRVALEALRSAVGGQDALDQLDDEPLPDEPFRWEQVPTDVHDRVAEVVALVDGCCDEFSSVEYRTACRRLLARTTAGDPSVFRRRGRPETAAAAICWIVGKANHLFAQWGEGILVKDLMAHFGLEHGSASQRAATLLRAGGFGTDHYQGIDLGSPDYLVSDRRRQIVDQREHYRTMEET